VLQQLGSGQMDYRTAGLMLYGLQTASVNLRNTQFEAEKATDVVIDRDTVDATSIGGPQWFEEDFEDEVEEEGEAEDDAGGEVAAGGAQVEAAAAREEAPESEVNHVSIEEARRKVQGLVRNWVLETVGEKVGAKPS
jgi:hypothetical protein